MLTGRCTRRLLASLSTLLAAPGPTTQSHCGVQRKACQPIPSCPCPPTKEGGVGRLLSRGCLLVAGGGGAAAHPKLAPVNLDACATWAVHGTFCWQPGIELANTPSAYAVPSTPKVQAAHHSLADGEHHLSTTHRLPAAALASGRSTGTPHPAATSAPPCRRAVATEGQQGIRIWWQFWRAAAGVWHTCRMRGRLCCQGALDSWQHMICTHLNRPGALPTPGSRLLPAARTRSG